MLVPHLYFNGRCEEAIEQYVKAYGAEVKMKITYPEEENKKGIISEYLPWLLIGIAILAILMIAIFYLRGEGFVLIDKIKNIFKMR